MQEVDPEDMSDEEKEEEARGVKEEEEEDEDGVQGWRDGDGVSDDDELRGDRGDDLRGGEGDELGADEARPAQYQTATI